MSEDTLEGGRGGTPAPTGGLHVGDLVASRVDTTTTWQGAGLLEDIESLNSSLAQGSWLGAGLSTVGAVADVASGVMNPIATLVSWGAGYLIEHFEPFKQWMDELAGSADQVRAHAQTWTNTAEAMSAQADSLESDVASLLVDGSGQMVEAARVRCAQTIDALRAGASATSAVSTALGVLAEVVGVVHGIVVSTLSDIIGQLTQAILEEVCSIGLATPVVAAQISTKVTAYSANVMPKITSLTNSAHNLTHMTSELSGKLDSMRAMFTPVGGITRRSRRKLDDLVDYEAWVGGRSPRATPRGGNAASHLRQANARRVQARANRVSLEHELDDKLAPHKSALDEHFTDRHKPRNPRSHMTVKRREDTLEYLRDQGVERQTLKDLNGSAEELTAARVAEARSAEEMGHAALEAKWDQMGIVQGGGVGGPGTGRGHVDTIGYRPGELHVGECKGGTSAKIGTYEVDGVKVEQGSAAYVGDRLARDTDFHQKMRENPALWEAIKDGRVQVFSDVAIARSGNAGRIVFKTNPIELDPAHIVRIDQAIKAL